MEHSMSFNGPWWRKSRKLPAGTGWQQAGERIQTPMAIVILFGLLTSMLLNMIVVPALYLRFGRPVEVD